MTDNSVNMCTEHTCGCYCIFTVMQTVMVAFDSAATDSVSR